MRKVNKQILWKNVALDRTFLIAISIHISFAGLVILGFVWTFTLRSVRYLILRKGGQTVAFVTYGPFGTNRIIDVPLKYISAVTTRESGSTSLPIKVRNRKFHYLLDKQGEFTNAKLFDHVINVKRRF